MAMLLYLHFTFPKQQSCEVVVLLIKFKIISFYFFSNFILDQQGFYNHIKINAQKKREATQR